ncbi:MAG: Spy/CpxP family protein refolding chaperone [Vicinamibacteria bacterium]
MKKHTLTVAALAVASFGWISIAAAQPPEGGPRRQGGLGGPGGPPAMGMGMGMMAEHLGLSDEQKTQIKAIHEKERETIQPLMKAVGESQRAFDTALNAEAPDAAAVGQAALAMRDARRSVEASQKATMEQIRAILTPEQAAKFDEMQKHMRGGRSGFGPGPGGPEGQGGPRRKPAPSAK